MFGLVVAITLSTTPVPIDPKWKPVADPLIEARQGRVQCDLPDHARKTCEGLVTYEFADDGAIRGISLTPIANNPPMSISASGTETLVGSELCSTITETELASMKVIVGKRVFKHESSEKLLNIFRGFISDMFLNKRVCERHYADGDRRLGVVTVDGVELPDLRSEFEWLAPDADYQLYTPNPLTDDSPAGPKI